MIWNRRPRCNRGYPMLNLATGKRVLAAAPPLMGLLSLLKVESCKNEPKFHWFVRRSHRPLKIAAGKILGLTASGFPFRTTFKLYLLGKRPLRLITKRDQSWTVYDARGLAVAGGLGTTRQVAMRHRLKEENKL